MTGRLLSTAALLFFMFAVSVQAARTEYIAQWQEDRLLGAEVCFFPAEADDGFFLKFLSSAEVRCLPADQVIDVPAGNWNIFLRHKDGFVSTHPDFVSGESETPEQQSAYRRVAIELHRAGAVDVGPIQNELGPGEHLAFYLSNEGLNSSPASVRPVATGETSVLLPLGMAVVPMIVRDAAPIWIGEPLTLQAGTKPAVSTMGGDDRLADVVVAVKIIGGPGEFDQIEHAPDVRLITSDGKQVPPLLPVRPGSTFQRSLVIFRGIPAGVPFRIVLEGRHWEAVEIASTGAPSGGSVFIPRSFIKTRPAGSLSVSWHPPERFEAAIGSCGDAGDAPAPVLIVRQCSDDVVCRERARRPIRGVEGGTEIFEGLPAGDYDVTLSVGPYSSQRTVPVTALETSVTKLGFEDAASVTGTVTRNGEPLHARIVFTGGGGGTSDLHTGFYTALIHRDPMRGQIVVTPCDGSPSHTILPAEPVYMNSVYQIEIEEGSLDVQVLSQEGSPISGAQVSLSLTEPGLPEVIIAELRSGRTDDDGRVTLAAVPLGVTLGICASHPRFRGRCQNLVISNLNDSTDIHLERRRSSRGRILAEPPVGVHGVIYWFTYPGTVTQTALVKPGGEFEFERTPDDREQAVFVSSHHPLTLLRSVSQEEELVYALRNGPARSISVTNPQDSGFDDATFTLAFGEHVIPEEVFASFQMRRGGGNRVRRGETVNTGTLVTSQPVSVLVAPTHAIGPEGRYHPFSSPPHILAIPRIPVPPTGRVVIP